MFHFVVAEGEKTWQQNPTEFPRDRMISAFKYTEKSLANEYGSLNKDVIEQLKAFPLLLADEGKISQLRVAALTKMTVYNRRVEVEYQLLDSLPSISMADILDNAALFGIKQSFEAERIHWALREGDLFARLAQAHIISAGQQQTAEGEWRQLTVANDKPEDVNPGVNPGANSGDQSAGPESEPQPTGQVLLACGQLGDQQQQLSDWIAAQGLTPVPLHASESDRDDRLEALSKGELRCDYALLLLTQGDQGYGAQRELLFSLGYCVAAMGRGKVIVLFEPGVEPLFDLPPWFYFLLKDDGGLWQQTLADIAAGID